MGTATGNFDPYTAKSIVTNVLGATPKISVEGRLRVRLLTIERRKVYNARHEGIFHGVGRGAVLQAPDMANRLMSEGWGIAILKFHNQEEGKRNVARESKRTIAKVNVPVLPDF